MIIVKKATELKKIISEKKAAGLLPGFVPTMGALHNGHISLLESAWQQSGLSVCSIFVNPAQFNNKEDFKNYPVTNEEDVRLLESTGCEILFLPSVDEVYPVHQSRQIFDLGYLDTVLEGKYRPGHFQGVCNAVYCLLKIVEPGILFLGQKDYQQCLVIKKMMQLTGQDEKVKVIINPTIREPNGLAMSSRNMRLSEIEKKEAGAIYLALQLIKKQLKPGDLFSLKGKARTILSANGLDIDYVEIADADTLQLVEAWDGKQKLVALVAASMNNVRLIDNMLLN